MDSLINALNLLKNDGKKMSGDIGISIKTLNDFLGGSSSEKTKKLVISYLRQKQDALNAHMEDFDNETIQTGKSDLINKNKDIEIIDAYYKSSSVGTNAKVICYISRNNDEVSCNKCIIKKGSICHNKKIENLDKSMDSLYKDLLLEDSPLKINDAGYYYFSRDYEVSGVSNALSILTGGRRAGWNDLLVEGTNEPLGKYVGYKPKKRKRNNNINNTKVKVNKDIEIYELKSDNSPSKELKNFAIKYLKHFGIEGNPALIVAVEAIKYSGGTANLSKDIYPYIWKYHPDEAREQSKIYNGLQSRIIRNVNRYTRGYSAFCGKEVFTTKRLRSGTFSLLHIKL